jgi:two-component system sensor histidine kinase ChiS
MRVLTLTSPALIVTLIAVTVPVARRGNRAARLFLWSWGVFLVGSVVNALRMRGALPTNAFTANTQQVGAALEALLLSIALADRTKALEREARRNAELARAATERALEEQERTNRELKRLDKLKDEFLANTSHELRTPLHGILGLTEAVLVTSPNLEGPARDRLGMVLASGRRLAALVNDILDFSKLRHHELALRVKTVELAQAVKLAITIAEPLVGEKALRLRSDVPEGLRVRVDENRLQQILTNLVGNAVKFTERGEVVVRARIDGPRVFVAVHDTGVGIAADAMERIFESFEQADGSTARQFGGTGLGLAVTRKLVELHGGSVTVASEVGVGSVFTFDVEAAPARADEDEPFERVFDELGSVGALPASVRYVDEPGAFALSPSPLHVPAPSSGPASAPVSGAAAGPPSGPASGPLSRALSVASRGHLLVADDDPVNVEVLRAQLEPAGYRVTTARDGREALEALAREGTFDGVLLDVMMPKMTGPEAAEQMRAEHPHGTLPILMLTAKSRPEDAVVGLRAGASDYVGKPFHREELLQRLDSHVQAVRTARAFRRFVPGDFLQLLGAEHFEELRAGVGQRHDLTVLFADIRNFTARSEQLGPEGTFAFVNGCLQRFEPVVRAHGGFVDKFIGDAVMAIFPGEATRAVEAAARLQSEVAAFNEAHAGSPMPLAIGIGVHRGPVILGTVGADDRLEVTAIGDAVNVAARLEALTKRFGVGALASKEVVATAPIPGDARCIGVVHVRGRREPIELFELLACCASAQEREQKTRTRSAFARALEAWRAGRMVEAARGFGQVGAEAPLDGVAAIYADQAQRFVTDGLPVAFDGELGAA